MNEHSPANNRASYRGQIFKDLTDTIGATPIVRLTRLDKNTNCKGETIGKCEFFNPLGSIKGRID
jgi:cysteine synthase A